MVETNGDTNGINGQHEVPQAINGTDAVTIQPPLSKRGHGPGLILFVPQGIDLNSSDKTLDPPPLQKWAEEGYAVAQAVVPHNADRLAKGQLLQRARQSLRDLPDCRGGCGLGLIVYNVPLSGLVTTLDQTSDIAVVNYGPFDRLPSTKPVLWHSTGRSSRTAGPYGEQGRLFDYPARGPLFAIPSHTDYNSTSAAVSHSRCLAFLKPLLKGPYFDLEAIWEEHTKLEFADRAVEETMNTMVQEPYVNHIPTITGGIGRKSLTDFYRNHFVFNNPEDTAMELVSRTVGIDRVIDEFVFSFTHDKEIDWILPGVPPTGKHVQVAFTGVINIRGDKLYHEHIAWDQATVLRQIGLMPEYLPFPYALPDGRQPAPGKRFEYQVPTAGVETAKKLLDERSVESNQMFSHAIREVDI